MATGLELLTKDKDAAIEFVADADVDVVSQVSTRDSVDPQDLLKKAEAETLRDELEKQIKGCGLLHQKDPICHDEGRILEIELEGVYPAVRAGARFELEKFVGGGFAGQVYRARLLAWSGGASLPGLEPGKQYALKFMKPPSSFSLAFRNLLYRIGYQSEFSLQVNRDAARAGALWQKLIRRGAALKFGSERHVADVYATFFDAQLHCYAEVGEWVEGRQWKLETDARLFERAQYLDENRDGDGDGDGDGEGKAAVEVEPPSPEYLGKKRFMRDLVGLFHEMGSPELARQYEWSTWKSQPNVLRRSSGTDEGMLTAIDFRPGLTLLFGLPMSPGDFRFVFRGLLRGRIAQFDGCSLPALKAFIEKHQDAFRGLEPVLDELQETDAAYRESIPDLLNRPWRALGVSIKPKVREASIHNWENLGLLDGSSAERLRAKPFLFRLLYLVSFMPWLGSKVMRFWGRATYRRHLGQLLASPAYLMRYFRAVRLSRLKGWHRDGRLSEVDVRTRMNQPVRVLLEWACLSWLPRPLHRLLGLNLSKGFGYLKEWMLFPIRFWLVPEMRERWLMGHVQAAHAEGMLSDGERDRISQTVKDPFIQKYLRCLGVHVCMLPVTRVFSLTLAIYFSLTYGKGFTECFALAVAVVAAIQLLPVSPGSIARGLYVVSLMIRERNIKDYRVAAFVSFWHYIGYLGFPIQMLTRYPGLARFLAARWARGWVHRIPVFGESGALLEHKVFDLFFNVPVSLRSKWNAGSRNG